MRGESEGGRKAGREGRKQEGKGREGRRQEGKGRGGKEAEKKGRREAVY